MKRTFTDPQTARESLAKKQASEKAAILDDLWESVKKHMAKAGPILPYVHFLYTYFSPRNEEFLHTLDVVAKNKDDLKTILDSAGSTCLDRRTRSVQDPVENDSSMITFNIVLRNVYFNDFSWPSDHAADKWLREMRSDRDAKLNAAHDLLVNRVEYFLSNPSSESFSIKMDIAETPYQVLAAEKVVKQLKEEEHVVRYDMVLVTSIENVTLSEPIKMCTFFEVHIS